MIRVFQRSIAVRAQFLKLKLRNVAGKTKGAKTKKAANGEQYYCSRTSCRCRAARLLRSRRAARVDRARRTPAAVRQTASCQFKRSGPAVVEGESLYSNFDCGPHANVECFIKHPTPFARVSIFQKEENLLACFEKIKERNDAEQVSEKLGHIMCT